jgi:uncharacterized protein YndB with AHSA1/START domain
MSTKDPQLFLTRVVEASRARTYKAFTDPTQFAAWWGPHGNELPLDEIEFDLRPGGYLRWKEVFPTRPGIWTRGSFDLTEVVEGTLLDGIMHITGQLPGGFDPFETRMRIEFYDVDEGRTRLEVSQWLPEAYVAPSTGGWGEAFSKLDDLLAT